MTPGQVTWQEKKTQVAVDECRRFVGKWPVSLVAAPVLWILHAGGYAVLSSNSNIDSSNTSLSRWSQTAYRVLMAAHHSVTWPDSRTSTAASSEGRTQCCTVLHSAGGGAAPSAMKGASSDCLASAFVSTRWVFHVSAAGGMSHDACTTELLAVASGAAP